jgi:hypothetical protein
MCIHRRHFGSPSEGGKSCKNAVPREDSHQHSPLELKQVDMLGRSKVLGGLNAQICTILRV